jgi:uncharacterized protein
MGPSSNPLAVVTGAPTGIGYELAKCCVEDGFDLVVVADDPEIKKTAADFQAMGAKVDALQADLATIEGVDKLYATIGGCAPGQRRSGTWQRFSGSEFR